MKIVVVGLGGVGGIVGGRLAAGLSEDPGHEVIFWCRGKTLEKVRDSGLTLLGDEGKMTVRPALATCNRDEVQAADLILFATKGYNLEEAARELAPLASTRTMVIPLLNGVSATAVLERLLPESDILGGCIYVSAHVETPGTVRQVGAVQRIFFGKKGLSGVENRMRYANLERLLQRSGIGVTLTERIDVEMWSKFLFLSPFAGVTTLHGCTIGEVLADDERFGTVCSLIREAEALARSHGVPLPANTFDLTVEKARSFAPFTKTSMQLDQEKGNPTEIESLIAYVCDEGRTRSVPTPTYDAVYKGLSALENAALKSSKDIAQ